MKIFEFYEQFTTNWEKIRAHITSHLIAASLLWLVGFQLPLPSIGLADIQQLPGNPLYPLLQNIGFLALVSFCFALIIGAYAVILVEVGTLTLTLVHLFFPPNVLLDDTRAYAPRGALFTIAATLDGGTYQAGAIGDRFGELISAYSISQPEVFKTPDQSHLQRDATTHFRNGLVFVLAWLVIPVVAHGTPLALAIEQVFWPGLAMLLIFVVVARQRLIFAFRMTITSLYATVSGLVQKDPDYQARLSFARAHPAPYLELVDAFQEKKETSPRPSLLAYARYRARIGHEEGKPARYRQSLLSRWNAFGYDDKRNQDFKNRDWPLLYLKWRVAALIYRIRSSLGILLMLLGMRRP